MAGHGSFPMWVAGSPMTNDHVRTNHTGYYLVTTMLRRNSPTGQKAYDHYCLPCFLHIFTSVSLSVIVCNNSVLYLNCTVTVVCNPRFSNTPGIQDIHTSRVPLSSSRRTWENEFMQQLAQSWKRHPYLCDLSKKYDEIYENMLNIQHYMFRQKLEMGFPCTQCTTHYVRQIIGSYASYTPTCSLE